MVKMIDELYVWEVNHYEVNESGDEGNCYDNDYIITTDAEYNDKWFDELIEAAGYDVNSWDSSKITVYLSRTSTLCTDKGNRLTVYEADCATGYSGSPVYEKYSDDVKLEEE